MEVARERLEGERVMRDVTNLVGHGPNKENDCTVNLPSDVTMGSGPLEARPNLQGLRAGGSSDFVPKGNSTGHVSGRPPDIIEGLHGGNAPNPLSCELGAKEDGQINLDDEGMEIDQRLIGDGSSRDR